jgi:hypothetical protein
MENIEELDIRDNSLYGPIPESNV